MARPKTRMKLDAYEQHIEDSIGEYIPVAPAEKKRILRTAGKTKTISLRINETVLESIKRKAAAEGIPYQALISSVLYKFSSNRLIDEVAIRMVINASK
jgi:predicted DNA binding CopG/RHH family protein